MRARDITVCAMVVACAACPSAVDDDVDGEGEGEPAGEGEGEGEDLVDCFIGDPALPAEIGFVGVVSFDPFVIADIESGATLPMVTSPFGGRVIGVGIRAKNVPCELLLNAGVFDACVEGQVLGREGRLVTLVEGADGFGRPVVLGTEFSGVFPNVANLPVCPAFVAARDMDDQVHPIQARVTERLRPGEAEERSHDLVADVHTVCGDVVSGGVSCECECDLDFDFALPPEAQCARIDDNDLPRGVCGGACDVTPCARGFDCVEDGDVASCEQQPRPAEPLFEAIGEPLFTVEDCLMIPAATGTFANLQPSFDAFAAFWSLHRLDEATNAIAPDEVHPPPYDTEPSTMAAALTQTPSRTFSADDWQEPDGLHLYCVVVPSEGAPTGKTTDFEDGPMIPDSALTLFIDGDVLLDDVVVDADFDGPYPEIEVTAPAAGADGYSHMPLSFSENTAFIAGVPGAYEWDITLLDENGDGWFLRFPFDVQ